MLISIAYILFSGLVLGALFKKMKLPALIGMILAGIIIGPHFLNLIDHTILDISSEIREITLIIILIKASFKLSFDDLKKIGIPAILMGFLPATLEIGGMILIAPGFFDISILEAAILGAVVAAVSPAAIVPQMIKLIDEKYGTEKGIPQMVLTGSSLDVVYVIVLFTTFTSLAKGGSLEVRSFINLPLSIIIGGGVGLIAGYLLSLIFRKMSGGDMVKLLMVLSSAFLLVTIEDKWGSTFPFAALIGVMAMGVMIKKELPQVGSTLASGFDKLWIPAEIFVFVLVGASVPIERVALAGFKAIPLIFIVVSFRMVGVLLSLIGTKFNLKERIFSMLSYTPKATVQAAIGGAPLAMGLACGEMVLTVSVVAILITAPLGALAMELTYKKLLEKEQRCEE